MRTLSESVRALIKILQSTGRIMANTNILIVGGVLLICGILTIPLGVGLLCAPAGCFVMLIGLVLSNPSPKQQLVYVQQPPGY